MICGEILSLQRYFTMKNKFLIGFLLFMAVLLASCGKEKVADTAVVGHWGCAQYVSCRNVDSLCAEQWDTLLYNVGENHGYEVYFFNDLTGELLLNDSPAAIKKFSCRYDYDEVASQIVIEAPLMLYSICHDVLNLNENKAEFNVEAISDTTMVASWTNSVSEPTPFFERFYLKRID